MIKPLLILLTLALSGTAMAKPQQTIPPITAEAHQRFDIQQRDIVVDAQRQYRIYIAQPRQPAPKNGYTVLYMLDGNGQFPLAVNSYQPSAAPAPLIIAIGYPTDSAYNVAERTRDYTPYSTDPEFALGGGADAFYQFIQQRLKPLIVKDFAVDTGKQTLAGHSFGGLFTLYVLFNHPESFQHYVAASPSIWWGNGIVIPQREPLLTAQPESITISVGEYEEKPMAVQTDKPQDPERLKRQAKRQQVTKARTLAEQLKQQHSHTQFILFPEKTHGSVIPDAVQMAVKVAGQ